MSGQDYYKKKYFEDQAICDTKIQNFQQENLIENYSDTYHKLTVSEYQWENISSMIGYHSFIGDQWGNI